MFLSYIFGAIIDCDARISGSIKSRWKVSDTHPLILIFPYKMLWVWNTNLSWINDVHFISVNMVHRLPMLFRFGYKQIRQHISWDSTSSTTCKIDWVHALSSVRLRRNGLLFRCHHLFLCVCWVTTNISKGIEVVPPGGSSPRESCILPAKCWYEYYAKISWGI